MRALTPAHPLWPEFEDALRQNWLATDDLGIPGQVFFVFEIEDRIVGYGGYAPAANAVFLRSIVVQGDRRRSGVGASIVRSLLDHAAGLDAQDAWLLTTDAAPFFERFGFVATARSEAPAAIADTPQFRGVCPGTATLMRLVLTA